jgi:cholest-4-en-3-one 26-monooxygenase
MTTTPTSHRDLANDVLDLLDPDNFVDGMPYAQLDELRAGPIRYFDEPGLDGFWVITRYHDVVQVSRSPQHFSSWKRGAILRGPHVNPDTEAESLESQRLMMLNMDPPDHTKLRNIVQKAFTPRVIRQMEERLRILTDDILDRALELGECDFVTEVAAELPLQAIAELMGVPMEDREKIFDWSNRLIGGVDPEYNASPEDTQEAASELYLYASELGSSRRQSPMGDIVSTLVTAEVDGHKLSEMEFEMFFLLLAVAGNETTRNSISHGMLAFFEHPDQWELLKSDSSHINTAVEEITRWATPVMHFQRTALTDVEVGGQVIPKDDRVAIYYATANRDPEIFDEPYRFDITRDPNPHIAFGGGGPHFCLGANLARLEMRVMFEALAKRAPNIEQAGQAQRLRSMFISGIKHLPVRFNT